MGVDARITLPGFVSVVSVADVIGILVGNRKQFGTLPGGHEYVEVEGVEVKGLPTLPGCADIIIKDETGEVSYYVLYHFEWQHDGTRGLMPRSRPDWLAIGKGLVDFFGGQIDYSDSDDVDVDYKVPPRTELADLNDGEVFDRTQERLRDLQSLTDADIEAMIPHAAYNLAGQWQ